MQNGLIVRKFNEVEIGHRVTDNYVNATAMCKATGKLLADYLRLGTTAAFLEALSSDMGIPISLLVQVRHGVRAGTKAHEQGTWVHPDIAIHLAQWCSAVFAVQVSKWVRELLSTGSVSLCREDPRDKMVYFLRQKLGMDMIVPPGRWSIFHHVGLVMDFIERGLMLRVGTFDLVDGSIGSHWSKWRTDQPWAGTVDTYPHEFPDRRGVVYPKAYLDSELPHFRTWLARIYVMQHLGPYLVNKYGTEARIALERTPLPALLTGSRNILVPLGFLARHV